jgi:hypothetical protein
MMLEIAVRARLISELFGQAHLRDFFEPHVPQVMCSAHTAIDPRPAF